MFVVVILMDGCSILDDWDDDKRASGDRDDGRQPAGGVLPGVHELVVCGDGGTGVMLAAGTLRAHGQRGREPGEYAAAMHGGPGADCTVPQQQLVPTQQASVCVQHEHGGVPQRWGILGPAELW